MQIRSNRRARRSNKKLKSTFILNEYQIQYYNELEAAHKNHKKLAAVSLGFPAELLWPFGIIPMYPQNHAAMYATFGMGRDVIEQMEGKGYLTDICSEIKIALGTLLHDLQLPYRLPRPDMVLAATNVCRPMAKFGEQLGVELNIPYFLLDVPFLKNFTPPEAHLAYVAKQFRELLEFFGDQTGTTPKPEEIKKAREQSGRAAYLWQDILELSATCPTPIDALDLYVHMFPIIALRGRKRVVDYYEILKSELQDWIKMGIGAVQNERYRLLWDYLPIYHKINFFSELFAARGACVVTSTFFFPLGGFSRLAGKQPEYQLDLDFERLARDFMFLYPNFSLRQKADTIKEIASKFSIDGVVIHSDRSCKSQSLMQYLLKNTIESEIDIPCIVIDSDSVDPRFFSEAQILNRLDAFLERLAQRRTSSG